MNSEIEDLLRAASYAPSDGQDIAAILMRGYSAAQGTPNAPSTESSSRRAEVTWRVPPLRLTSSDSDCGGLDYVAPSQTTARHESSPTKETNVAETVLKTAEMVTGVGPIVTGLMKLFGST